MSDRTPQDVTEIIERLEKRFGEVGERANPSNRMFSVWTDEVMTIVHYEIDRILNGVDMQ
jgi:hypothetical protein